VRSGKTKYAPVKRFLAVMDIAAEILGDHSLIRLLPKGGMFEQRREFGAIKEQRAVPVEVKRLDS
jgi:hypothetical protein